MVQKLGSYSLCIAEEIQRQMIGEKTGRPYIELFHNHFRSCVSVSKQTQQWCLNIEIMKIFRIHFKNANVLTASFF